MKVIISYILFVAITTTTTTTTVLQPFFQDNPGEPAPEENFWTLWCKGILTEADTLTIQMGATPFGLTSAHLHHPPHMALEKPGKLGEFFSPTLWPHCYSQMQITGC